MRMVFGLVLIVGVGLAGGAVMMAKNYIEAYQMELAKERAAREAIVPTVEVLVSKSPLRYGEILKPEAVRAVRWPEDAVPEGAFLSKDALFPNGNAEPRFVLRAMEKDEAIMAIKVTAPGEDAGLISRLEKGMRAFAIRVDVASGVSGFLRPGDRVDIYWTGRLPGNNNRTDVTKLIESGITLIAIDQTAGGDLDGAVIARTVTVAARPDQVAKLAQAQSTGGLSLALLGADDDTVTGRIEVDQNALLGLAEAEIIEQKKERVCTIRTRRGAEVVEIPIPCTN
ncbi:Flp pilus assembly protein CpaB [Aestuariivita boseongensis]|uniref:Flp pilus assembly protein CpaB n=1 Tax=Aestuariivita boseongensis TaxID=1470562 RepID=UPI000682235E|nr:Flp pilus assembly protein CpaB [Aestuariivita boseongensis]